MISQQYGGVAILIVLVIVGLLASMGQAIKLSSMTRPGPTGNLHDLHLFRTRQVAPSPVQCYRKIFPKELDQRVLAYEIVVARLAIHEKLSLLDRFHHEAENGLLDSDCLLPYRQYMAGDNNMDDLLRCNQALVDDVVQPLIDAVANATHSS